ncbi:hypothetical protein M9458_047777, partial [Cirrhinus mrigala]
EPQQNTHSTHNRTWNHSAGKPCCFLYFPFGESSQWDASSTGSSPGGPGYPRRDQVGSGRMEVNGADYSLNAGRG